MVVKFRGRISTCKDLLTPQRGGFHWDKKRLSDDDRPDLNNISIGCLTEEHNTAAFYVYDMQNITLTETFKFSITSIVPSLDEGCLILFPFCLLLQKLIELLSILGLRNFQFLVAFS